MGIFKQNSQKSQQQNREPLLYPEPPNVVTSKDLTYMKDMLGWNLLAAKKMKAAGEQCQLPDLKKEFQAAEKMYNQHYDNVLEFLKSNQGGQQ